MAKTAQNSIEVKIFCLSTFMNTYRQPDLGDKMLAYLATEVRVTQQMLYQHFGVTRQAVLYRLNQLMKLGLIRRVAYGIYELSK